MNSGSFMKKIIGLILFFVAIVMLLMMVIHNMGEGMIAKRRAYATLQSHLTPPFMESDVRGIYKELCTAIQRYNDLLYADGKPCRRVVRASAHRRDFPSSP